MQTATTNFDKKSLIEIRNYRLEDRNFVLASWLRGLYYGDSWFKEVPKNVFMLHYHRILENLIVHPAVRIRIACLKEDQDVILGYAVTREADDGTQVLDWIFVKSAWRNIGIGKSLLPSKLQVFSHATKSGLSIAKAKYPQLIFNPFLT